MTQTKIPAELIAAVNDKRRAALDADYAALGEHLSRRGIEYDLLPWCQERSIPIMAYSPIEQGRLLHHPELIRVAKTYQATPAQIALAFLLERDGVMAIPKSANSQRVEENRDSIDIDMTDEDWAVLDAAFPPPSRKKPLDML